MRGKGVEGEENCVERRRRKDMELLVLGQGPMGALAAWRVTLRRSRYERTAQGRVSDGICDGHWPRRRNSLCQGRTSGSGELLALASGSRGDIGRSEKTRRAGALVPGKRGGRGGGRGYGATLSRRVGRA